MQEVEIILILLVIAIAIAIAIVYMITMRNSKIKEEARLQAIRDSWDKKIAIKTKIAEQLKRDIELARSRRVATGQKAYKAAIAKEYLASLDKERASQKLRENEEKLSLEKVRADQVKQEARVRKKYEYIQEANQRLREKQQKISLERDLELAKTRQKYLTSPEKERADQAKQEARVRKK